MGGSMDIHLMMHVQVALTSSHKLPLVIIIIWAIPGADLGVTLRTRRSTLL